MGSHLMSGSAGELRWAGHVARGGEQRQQQGFGGEWGNLKERVPSGFPTKTHLRDPGIDGRIMLRRILEVGCGCVDWIELAQDRDRWRALVTEVMNLRVL